MSTQRLTRDVHCGNDCRQEGCPGHELTLVHHNTSDTVSILLDGKIYGAIFDEVIWHTLVNMEEESRTR